MTTNRSALRPSELESLRVLAAGTKPKRAQAGHGTKLIRCGFAVDRTGALAITITGRAKLVIELTRASWAPAPVLV